MQKAVLFVSYDGMTDPLGQSQVIPYLAGLRKLGYSIHLISFEKEEQEARKPFITQLLKELDIQWHPLRYTKKPPVLSTLYDVYRMKKLARKLHAQYQFKAIHCRSYVSALVGLSLKKSLKIPFIFDMRGFWADERVDGNLWPQSSFLYRKIYAYFKKKEKQFLENADYIISLTHNAKEEMCSWKHVNRKNLPIQVIPCCADLSLFSYEAVKQTDAKEMRTKLAISEEQFVVSYLGAIGTWYLLDEMMLFFSVFLKKHPNAIFLFITAENPKLVSDAAAKFGVSMERIRVLKANREQVPVLLSLSKFSVFFIKPSYSKKASSPTKQAEIMGMGLPVLCNAGVGDTDFVLNKYKTGVLVQKMDADEFERISQSITDLLSIDSHKIREAALDFYSLEEGVRRYAEVYSKLIR